MRAADDNDIVRLNAFGQVGAAVVELPDALNEGFGGLEPGVVLAGASLAGEFGERSGLVRSFPLRADGPGAATLAPGWPEPDASFGWCILARGERVYSTAPGVARIYSLTAQ